MVPASHMWGYAVFPCFMSFLIEYLGLDGQKKQYEDISKKVISLWSFVFIQFILSKMLFQPLMLSTPKDVTQEVTHSTCVSRSISKSSHSKATRTAQPTYFPPALWLHLISVSAALPWPPGQSALPRFTSENVWPGLSVRPLRWARSAFRATFSCISANSEQVPQVAVQEGAQRDSASTLHVGVTTQQLTLEILY